MRRLLMPIDLGSLHLKNRLIMPPMATGKSMIDGTVSQGLIDYYNEKSKGGYFSLIIIEHSYIREDGRVREGQLSVSRDSDIDGLRRLAEVIHNNSSKCAMQINHAGGQVFCQNSRGPLSPSGIQIPACEIKAREMTAQDIKEVTEAFGRAAIRVREAGFDAVEIHSAHGYLLNQFYSPLTNHRIDAYGGSLENRIRLHLEVIESVKKVVGADYPVLLRLGAGDYMEGGTTSEDSAAAAVQLQQAGIHAIDVSGGICRYDVKGLSGQGYFSPLSQAVKEAASIPVILTGGITEPLAADRLLLEGKADLIGVGRAVLKDSDWARRAIEELTFDA